ncbi:MAG TPA: hypothetical protein VFH96_07645 [Pyrinomonadaceae bacterium]|nr:hypothetical protein [Pyrinomonadaceae bacterium]
MSANQVSFRLERQQGKTRVGIRHKKCQELFSHKKAQKAQKIFPCTSFVLFVPFCGKIAPDDGATIP